MDSGYHGNSNGRILISILIVILFDCHPEGARSLRD